MPKLATIRRYGLVMSVLLAVLQSPLRAELSATDLSAELLAARDEARTPLLTWQAAVTAKTKDEFEAVKGKLARPGGRGAPRPSRRRPPSSRPGDRRSPTGWPAIPSGSTV